LQSAAFLRTPSEKRGDRHSPPSFTRYRPTTSFETVASSFLFTTRNRRLVSRIFIPVLPRIFVCLLGCVLTGSDRASPTSLTMGNTRTESVTGRHGRFSSIYFSILCQEIRVKFFRWLAPAGDSWLSSRSALNSQNELEGSAHSAVGRWTYIVCSPTRPGPVKRFHAI
jgi:hypothetical protein